MGLPLDYNRKDTIQSRKAIHFSKILKLHLKLPVEFENEFGSTQDTNVMAIKYGIHRKARKTVDHYTAALILKNYYEEKSPKYSEYSNSINS
jgi:RNase H-fold protein (predicted Holliday junction resolvase)